MKFFMKNAKKKIAAFLAGCMALGSSIVPAYAYNDGATVTFILHDVTKTYDEQVVSASAIQPGSLYWSEGAEGCYIDIQDSLYSDKEDPTHLAKGNYWLYIDEYGNAITTDEEKCYLPSKPGTYNMTLVPNQDYVGHISEESVEEATLVINSAETNYALEVDSETSNSAIEAGDTEINISITPANTKLTKKPIGNLDVYAAYTDGQPTLDDFKLVESFTADDDLSDVTIPYHVKAIDDMDLTIKFDYTYDDPTDEENRVYFNPVNTSQTYDIVIPEGYVKTDKDKLNDDDPDEESSTTDSEESTQSTTEADDESQSSTKSDEESQSSTTADDKSQSSTKSEEFSQSTTTSDDEHQSSTKSEEASQSFTKSEETSQSTSESDDEHQSSTKSEETSQSTSESDDESQSSTSADNETQSSTSADESQSSTKSEETSQSSTEATSTSEESSTEVTTSTTGGSDSSTSGSAIDVETSTESTTGEESSTESSTEATSSTSEESTEATSSTSEESTEATTDGDSNTSGGAIDVDEESSTESTTDEESSTESSTTTEDSTESTTKSSNQGSSSSSSGSSRRSSGSSGGNSSSKASGSNTPKQGSKTVNGVSAKDGGTLKAGNGDNGYFFVGSKKTAVPTPIAEEGYEFSHWTVNGEEVDSLDGERLKSTDKIEAVFNKLPEEQKPSIPDTPSVPSIPDTPSSNKGISEKVVRNIEKYTFNTAGNITRGELAQAIALAMTDNNIPKGISRFSDVDSDNMYADAISYLTSQGIFSGFGDNTFRTNGTVTKAQLAVILSKMLKLNVQPATPGVHWSTPYVAAVSQYMTVDSTNIDDLNSIVTRDYFINTLNNTIA